MANLIGGGCLFLIIYCTNELRGFGCWLFDLGTRDFSIVFRCFVDQLPEHIENWERIIFFLILRHLANNFIISWFYSMSLCFLKEEKNDNFNTPNFPNFNCLLIHEISKFTVWDAEITLKAASASSVNLYTTTFTTKTARDTSKTFNTSGAYQSSVSRATATRRARKARSVIKRKPQHTRWARVSASQAIKATTVINVMRPLIWQGLCTVG